MIVFPNAKINLGLHIIDKRPDGYHNIETCFYPIGWKDILEIIPADTLAFSSSGLPIPGDASQNLCLKAYQLLKNDFDLPPVQIHLHKIVPIGAGLGGGSADAAFTIRLLNETFQLGISEDNLAIYAAKLGSDCAFFIKNEPVFAIEKGEVWQDIDMLDLRFHHLVVVFPKIHISTAEAYQSVKKRGKTNNLYKQLALPLAEWRNTIENDFEKSVFENHPSLQKIKNLLYEEKALYASMSGSGSAMFGIFRDEPDLDKFKQNEALVWAGEL
ncbi:MAG: 4-(cytidine 5'-diphospho)-2-C-methyl-D-erythritol kinase [Cytophagales bacterium]